MTQDKYPLRQMLLNEIACALTDHITEDYGSGHFADLTTGEVTFIQSEYMLKDHDLEVIDGKIVRKRQIE